MIPGIELTDGATRLVVAPMSLRIQLEEPTKPHVDRVLKGTGDDTDSFTQSAIEVLLACARRNTPNATRDQLLDLVDSADLVPMLLAVLHKSGFGLRPLTVPRVTTTGVPATPTPSPAPASSDSSSTPPDGSPTTSLTDSPGATTST